jgi:hypothetical protein
VTELATLPADLVVVAVSNGRSGITLASLFALPAIRFE